MPCFAADYRATCVRETVLFGTGGRRCAERVWSFETKNFLVTLDIERQYDYVYDGDDEDGETQRDIESGRLIAFDSCVTVWLKPPLVAVGSDHLGGSIYPVTEESDFWTAHRDPNPLNRNCTVVRAGNPSPNAIICHYFPAMVREAVRNARQTLRGMPQVRDPTKTRRAA